MKILYFMGILVLLSPVVAAQEFHTYSIRADVSEKGVYEVVEITLSGISELSYVVEGDIDKVSPVSSDGEIVHSVERGTQSFVVVSNLSGKEHLKLSFFTNAPLNRQNGEVEALFKLRFPVDVEKFSLLVVLPEHALPVSTEDGFSMFPSPDKQFIEGNNRYNVLWERDTMKAGDEIVYSITYTLPRKSYLPYLLAFFVFLGAVFWLFYVTKRKRELFLRGLGKEERKIVELLMKSKEGYQHELREEIGVSKVKMTRVVQKLEEKGLIEKTPVGKRNKLTLKI
jgi:hypothetical protein